MIIYYAYHVVLSFVNNYHYCDTCGCLDGDERRYDPQDQAGEKAPSDPVGDGHGQFAAPPEVSADAVAEAVGARTRQEVHTREVEQLPYGVRVGHERVHFQRGQRAVGQDDDRLELCPRFVGHAFDVHEKADGTENRDRLDDQQERSQHRAVNVVAEQSRPVRVQQLIEAQLSVRR